MSNPQGERRKQVLRRKLVAKAARFLDRRGWDMHEDAAQDVADFVELKIEGGEPFRTKLVEYLKRTIAEMEVEGNTGPDIMGEMELKDLLNRIENGEFDGPNKETS